MAVISVLHELQHAAAAATVWSQVLHLALAMDSILEE